MRAFLIALLLSSACQNEAPGTTERVPNRGPIVFNTPDAQAMDTQSTMQGTPDAQVMIPDTQVVVPDTQAVVATQSAIDTRQTDTVPVSCLSQLRESNACDSCQTRTLDDAGVSTNVTVSCADRCRTTLDCLQSCVSRASDPTSCQTTCPITAFDGFNLQMIRIGGCCPDLMVKVLDYHVATSCP